MAAYSYGSSYESLMKKNCAYRQLSNYYQNLFENTTSADYQTKNSNEAKVVVVPEFGGIPYESYSNPAQSKDTVAGISCDTWRKGECCDSRVLSKNSYIQCPDGLCPGYSNLASNSNTSRY